VKTEGLCRRRVFSRVPLHSSVRQPAPRHCAASHAEAPGVSLVDSSEHASARYDARQLISAQHDVWSDCTYAVDEDNASVSIPELGPGLSSDPHVSSGTLLFLRLIRCAPPASKPYMFIGSPQDRPFEHLLSSLQGGNCTVRKQRRLQRTRPSARANIGYSDPLILIGCLIVLASRTPPVAFGGTLAYSAPAYEQRGDSILPEQEMCAVTFGSGSFCTATCRNKMTVACL
jgi:hypothetical protein